MSPLDSLDFCRRLGWAQAQPCAVWGAEGPDTLGWSEKKMEGRFRKHLEEYSPLLIWLRNQRFYKRQILQLLESCEVE